MRILRGGPAAGQYESSDQDERRGGQKRTEEGPGQKGRKKVDLGCGCGPCHRRGGCIIFYYPQRTGTAGL